VKIKEIIIKKRKEYKIHRKMWNKMEKSIKMRELDTDTQHQNYRTYLHIVQVDADTTGFGLNILPYSGFGLRCKTSLCFENNFALGLSHNQYRYNLNYGSNSPCDLPLCHAIPWS